MSGSKASAATASQTAQPMGGRAVVRKSRHGMRAIPVSHDAQRVATAILEVLAGVRTPTDAAMALSLSVPRYYLWEQRALEGLVRACEPRPKGQVMSQRHQITLLEKEVARLRQDCARQQALVRASQRTIGLAASAPPATRAAAKAGGKATAGTGAPACGSRSAADVVAGKAKRKRRPVARALKAVAALQASPAANESLAKTTSATAAGADVVQQSVPSSSLAAAGAAAPACGSQSAAVLQA